MPLEIRGKHLRVRVRKPVKGAVYRTHDVGILGHTKRVAMWTKKTGWVTQSWMFPVEDILARRRQTVEILKKLGVWERAYRMARRRSGS